MEALLRWLSRRRPWQVLVTVLALSIVASPLDASEAHPVLLPVGAALGAVIMFGYPLLVIFGFPEPYATPSRRRIAFGNCMLLCVMVLLIAVRPAPGLQMPEWLRLTFGMPLIAALFAPFFVATAVVDDARRALGQYVFGDCISTWLGILGYPLGGVFLVQRKVAAALVALKLSGGAIAV